MIKRDICEYNFPNALKTMSLEEMNLLAGQIRQFLLDNVSKTGGHLASNLGVVELTIALHKYFNSPVDRIIWDVGHQSYVHKILTGRAREFGSLRQLDGISGFPKISESEHDVIGTGHSSNSISIAAGIAEARDRNNEDYSVVAVIGDGALTGGMAYEALNNVGASKSNIVVILNDNGMSISKNKGSMSQHLSSMRTSKKYQEFKSSVKSALKNVPSVYHGVEHLKDTVKYALGGGAVFEELGFTYLGPVDGHDIEAVLNTLSLARRVKGPVIIHAITRKGKGYIKAEENPGKFHGIGPFDIETGEAIGKGKGLSYSRVFGDKLTELAGKDKRVVAVCAAMIDGTGLDRFAKVYPSRLYDTCIAEQHAVSFAAGLARDGLRPVVAIYSTFLQRAYDQIMMDVCLNNLPVIFAIDRAGNVGNDGQTHHGLFDMSYLSHMPGMTVLSPRDGLELEDMLEYALKLDGPVAIRYPRGNTVNFEEMHDFDGHNYFMVNQNNPQTKGLFKEKKEKLTDVEIWASGKMVKYGMDAIDILNKKGYRAGLVNNCVIKPIDTELLNGLADRTKLIVTLEDNVFEGGIGQQIDAFLLGHDIKVRAKNIAWPDEFIEHGNTEKLFERYKMDAVSIAERIEKFIEG